MACDVSPVAMFLDLSQGLSLDGFESVNFALLCMTYSRMDDVLQNQAKNAVDVGCLWERRQLWTIVKLGRQASSVSPSNLLISNLTSLLRVSQISPELGQILALN